MIPLLWQKKLWEWDLLDKDVALQFISVDEELQEANDEIANLHLSILALEQEKVSKDDSIRKLQDVIGLMKEGVTKYDEFLDRLYERKLLRYVKRKVYYADVDVRVDVRDFITNFNTMKNSLSEEQIWSFFIKYVSDNYKDQGLPDYWQFPAETKVLCKGDCEDSSFFRVSMAKNSSKIDQDVKDSYYVALGFLKQDGSLVGHAFPVKIDLDKGILCVVEATSNVFDVLKDTSDYMIFYLFNERFCWVVDDSVDFGNRLENDFGVLIDESQ